MDPPASGAMSLDSASIGSRGAGVLRVLDLLSTEFLPCLDVLIRPVDPVVAHDENETTAELRQ